MKQYHELLRSILDNGTEHRDRTGVGTISHFGFQTRFNLRDGFPIVTTKRVPFRWVAEELFWFLSGDTSETNLRARGVDIWAEWADEDEQRREGWPKPGVVSVDLNSSFRTAFQSGDATGIALGRAPSSSDTYNGRFDGATETYPATLTITYTK